MAILPLSDNVQSKLTPLSFNDFLTITSGQVKVIDVTGDISSLDADTYAGGFLVCDMTSPAVVDITLPDDIEYPIAFQCVKEGTANISFSVSGSATVNGGTSAVVVSTRYSQAYIVHKGGGVWYASGKDI